MFMRLRVLFVVGALALTGSPALAAEYPTGAQPTIDFSIKWVTKGDTAINHLYKGTCKMIVTQPVDKDLDGKGGNASRQATGEELSAEAQKCGQDTECLRKVMAKIQSSGVVKMEPNYVHWGPTSCSGTLSADDTVVAKVSDDGEGGPQYFTTTTTTKGSAAVTNCGDCVRLQFDLKKKVTEYRFAEPSVPGEYLQTKTGLPMNDVPRKVRIRAFPEGPHPTLLGPPQSGRVIRPVPGGEVTIEWWIKQ
jgi:hypothetical protein